METFLAWLVKFNGGKETRPDAIMAYLKSNMECAKWYRGNRILKPLGEETYYTYSRMILSNIKNARTCRYLLRP